MTGSELSERPSQVTVAIRLYLAVIAIGVIQAVMLALRHIEVRSPDLLIASKVAIYALSFFLLYRVGQGDNWARWLMAAILIVAIPLASLPTLQSFTHYPLYGLLEIVSIALYVGATMLLFGKRASTWFVDSE